MADERWAEDQVRDLVDRLKEIGKTDDPTSNEIPPEYMEAFGDMVKTLRAMVEVDRIGTVDELTDLFADPNPEVQMIAVLGLASLIEMDSYADQAARSSLVELRDSSNEVGVKVCCILGLYNVDDPRSIAWVKMRMAQERIANPVVYFSRSMMSYLLQIAGAEWR